MEYWFLYYVLYNISKKYNSQKVKSFKHIPIIIRMILNFFYEIEYIIFTSISEFAQTNE